MIRDIIVFTISNYPLSFLLVALLCSIISIAMRRLSVSSPGASETLLYYYCLFPIALNYLLNFVMHVFFADMAAHFIGWEPSPFQQEVGFASLGFAVVGFLALRRDFGLRLAAVTGPAFFLWGAAGGHVYHMVADHNFAPGNAGTIFWMDIVLPIIGIVLLVVWRRSHPAEQGAR